MTRSPTLEPIMMMRPPLFMCFRAACVATKVPRTLMSIRRSNSSSVVSSNVFGTAVPALFTRTSSRPNVATVFSTEAAASAPFVYVMATFAPSAARRLAIAAPMPRDPPVMSAIFPSSFFDIVFLLFLLISLFGDPVLYVGRTVHETDAFCLTRSEKANHVDVHQTHFLQIQRNP